MKPTIVFNPKPRQDIPALSAAERPAGLSGARVGFVDNSKESIGLGAIRERLAVPYGATAHLDISRTADGWTRVAIRIPMAA